MPEHIGKINFIEKFDNSNDDSFWRDRAEAFREKLMENHFVVLGGEAGKDKDDFLKFSIEPIIDSGAEFIYIKPGLDPVKSIAYAFSLSNFSEKKIPNTIVGDLCNVLEQNKGVVNLFEEYPVKKGKKLFIIIDPIDEIFLPSNGGKSDAGEIAERNVTIFLNFLYSTELYVKALPVYIIVSFSNTFPEKMGLYTRLLDLLERNAFFFENYPVTVKDDFLDFMIRYFIKEREKFLSEEKRTGNLETELKVLIKKDLNILLYKNEFIFILIGVLHRTLEKYIHFYSDGQERSIKFCYQEVGGINGWIGKELGNRYNSFCGQNDRYTKIYELVIRMMIDGHGNFRSCRYGTIVDSLTDFFDPKDKKHIEENCIRPFINDLAKSEIGFFVIIRSMNEVSRALLLTHDGYIDEDDVVVIRNKYMAQYWLKIGDFIRARFSLLSEYEWYSRIAYNEKKEIKDRNETYPVALREYVFHENKKNFINDFKAISEILCLNEAWEEKNYPEKRNGFANVFETKAYIQNGITYWKQVLDQEEKRIRKGKRKNKNTIYSILGTLFLFLVVSITGRIMTYKLDKLKEQYDCLLVENQRIISVVDEIKLNKLKIQTISGSVMSLDFMNELHKLEESKDSLLVNQKKIMVDSDSIYRLNELVFAWKYRKLESRIEKRIFESDRLSKSVLSTLIDTVKIQPVRRYNRPKIPTDRAVFSIISFQPVKRDKSKIPIDRAVFSITSFQPVYTDIEVFSIRNKRHRLMDSIGIKHRQETFKSFIQSIKYKDYKQVEAIDSTSFGHKGLDQRPDTILYYLTCRNCNQNN